MSAPSDIQSAQQALELLEKVRLKALVEMWITLMMVGGLAFVILSEICKLLRLEKTSSIFVVGYGYTMTYIPATAALYGGWACVLLGASNIVRDFLSDRSKQNIYESPKSPKS